MIQTQSQNDEIRQIEKIAWRKDRDKVWHKVGSKVWSEVYYKARRKVWSEVWVEAWRKLFL